jgi:hypothetical protein
MSTIEKSIADFYATPEVTGEMASAIAERFEMVSGAATVVRDEVSGNARWLGKEMSDLLRTGFHENVSSGMAISLGQTVHQFIGSAAGKAMLSTMTKAMAGGMGKVLVTKIASIVASVVGSSAFHTAVVAVVKKIGLTVLVKTVVGKAIIALLALLGISTTVPIAWIILPLIAGLLVWEYKTFPEKLANKVPGEVVTAIRSKFDQLNESVSASVIESVYKQFEK